MCRHRAHDEHQSDAKQMSDHIRAMVETREKNWPHYIMGVRFFKLLTWGDRLHCRHKEKLDDRMQSITLMFWAHVFKFLVSTLILPNTRHISAMQADPTCINNISPGTRMPQGAR